MICANRTACFCHPRKLRRQKILLQFKITILSNLELRLFSSLTPICLFHTNKFANIQKCYPKMAKVTTIYMYPSYIISNTVL